MTELDLDTDKLDDAALATPIGRYPRAPRACAPHFHPRRRSRVADSAAERAGPARSARSSREGSARSGGRRPAFETYNYASPADKRLG